MKHDLIHFVAYSAIFLALLFWPTHEHATACFAYGALAGFSLSGAIYAFREKLTCNRSDTCREDLRKNLPQWRSTK